MYSTSFCRFSGKPFLMSICTLIASWWKTKTKMAVIDKKLWMGFSFKMIIFAYLEILKDLYQNHNLIPVAYIKKFRYFGGKIQNGRHRGIGISHIRIILSITSCNTSFIGLQARENHFWCLFVSW